MKTVKLVFKAIDVLFENTQNKRSDMKDTNNIVAIENDIIYDEKYADVCKLDLYNVPKANGEKHNVLLYIHGGGWEAGDKKYRVGLSTWFALHGWYVVNINYALCPEYKYPVPVQNVVSAYNWVIDNAEKYNFNLKNFVVTGDSAGAYFAMMIGAIDKSGELQQKLECKTKYPVQSLLLDCGMYDMRHAFVTKPMIFGLGSAMLKDYIDVDRKGFDDSEYGKYSSPVDYITNDFPPCFVTYSKKDLFCGGQGEILEAELSKKGVYFEEYHSKHFSNNHCFPINQRGRETAENEKYTLDFLERFCNRDKLQNWHISELENVAHKSTKVLENRARHSLKKAEQTQRRIRHGIKKHDDDLKNLK